MPGKSTGKNRKKDDKDPLELAKELSAECGGKKLVRAGAVQLWKTVNAKSDYTDKEKLTALYGIKTHCRFTEKAHIFLRTKVHLLEHRIGATLTKYYKIIDGKRYDREMIEVAKKWAAKSASGKLTRDAVSELYKAVVDSDRYTDVEKRTMDYIRKHYEFTEAADKQFRTMIRSWAGKKSWRDRQTQDKVT